MSVISVPRPVREVAARLSGAGFAAVVVGGAVRDSLLGREVKDWDLATDAVPEQVVRLFPGTRATTRFGTALVPTDAGIVEVTTFRTEEGYSDFRRPDLVAFTGSLPEDLARRDLTINAIAYDPVRDILHDPFGGRADLAARRIRAVGRPEDRFGEDALRLLRAARFAASLGFSIESATEAAMALRSPLADHLASERVGTELARLLTAPRAADGVRILARTGIAARILPELSPAAIADGAAVIDAARSTSATEAVAALFHHAGASGAAASAALRSRVHVLGIGDDIGAAAGRLVLVVRMSPDDLRSEADAVRAVRPYAHAEVAAAIGLRRLCRALPGTAVLAGRIAAAYASGLPITLAGLAVSGDDLVAAGTRPGPVIGKTLARLHDMVIERRVPNTREALLAAASRVAAV